MKYLKLALSCGSIGLLIASAQASDTQAPELISCPALKDIKMVQNPTNKDTWLMQGAGISSKGTNHQFKGYLPVRTGVDPKIGQVDVSVMYYGGSGFYSVICKYKLDNDEYKDTTLNMTLSLPAQQYSSCTKKDDDVISCVRKSGGLFGS